ncbi:hypothetical protein, partial [Burkholderia vietnamiensis]|uniref:hypothetical protein n=1 Tax=Burkholderia vietnamiensis TaxID=60552 RepID=UPI001CF33071
NMPTVITSVSPAQRLSRAFNHVGQNSMKTTASGGSVLRGHQQARVIHTTWLRLGRSSDTRTNSSGSNRPRSRTWSPMRFAATVNGRTPCLAHNV